MRIANNVSIERTNPIRVAVFIFMAAVCGVAFLCGCQAPGPTGEAAASIPESAFATYSTNLLHEGDLVNVSFQYFSNYNTLQKITLDGELNLEGIGPVKASGKTQRELQDQLTERYKSLTKGDPATVKLVSASASVYVAGAVFHPGRVALDRPLTALEAVIEAGGYDPARANLDKVRVIRIVNGKLATYLVNLNRVLRGKEELPFYLKPFDIINVPSKTFNY